LSTLVNGQATQHVCATDRGLLYGQTVFETIAVTNQTPQLYDRHMVRLQRGCDVIGIPFDAQLQAAISQEASALCRGQSKAVLRITLTMGAGGRGYRNPDHKKPNRILSLHDYPDFAKEYWFGGIELGLVSIRLANQPSLAGIKHGNRLEQIIARNQWQESWQEALILDQQNQVIEGTQSNVFMLKDGRLYTPDLSQCGVDGVMREYVIEQALKLGVTTEIVSLSRSDISSADEVFLTSSVIGLWPVKRYQSTDYGKPIFSSKLLNLMIKNEVIPHI